MGSRGRWLHSSLVLGALLVFPTPIPAGAPELAATWERSGCRVDLEIDREDGILRLRPRCPLSRGDAEKALSETLPGLRDRGDSPPRYRLLFLGRLVDYPWMSEGLARWAARSAEWDTRKGLSRRERSGNAFVERALADGAMLRPLADALAREGVRVVGAAAEKVLISRVGELPFGDRLRAEGISRDARVPFDAMVHLILRPVAGRSTDPD